MVSVYSICLLTSTLATLLPGLASSSSVSKRDVSMSALIGFKGAILVMNGSQTSCEAALIDSSAAFIAASCLQYKDGKLDDSAKYELMVKMGDNSAGSQLYPITTISVHPKFDSSIFINNLAVVQYNKGAAIAWNYNIGINPSEWNTNYFARRSLKNLGAKEWNNISALESIAKPADCSKYSKVYGSNSKDFICNAGDISSIYNNACAVPYGTVYSVVQPNNINIAAIHSHSVVVDGSLCSGQQKLHYYTLLRNYAAWAAKEINRSIGGFVANPDFTMKANYTYSMKSNTGTVNGVEVFAGNRYTKDPVDPALAQPPSSPSPTPKSTTTSTTTSSTSTKTTSSTTTSTTHSTTHSTTNTHDTPTLPSDSDSDSDDSSSGSSDDSQESNTSPKSGGISTTVIAIIAIVLIILIGVGVWFYMRRKKRIQLQQQLEEADKWDDKDDQNLPAAMRMTNDFGYQNNLPPPTNNYAHDFGDRRADSPAVPPQKGGGSHLNNPYRESEYAPESRPNYGGQRPDTHYTTDNRYSEYTDAIGQQGYGNNYNAGYRR